MKAIIFLEWPHEQMLPDYFKEGGGGYACIGHIPTNNGEITMLWIDVSQSVYNQLIVDTNVFVIGEVGMVEDKKDLESTAVDLASQNKAKTLLGDYVEFDKLSAKDKDISTVEKLVKKTCAWFNVPSNQVIRLLSEQEDEQTKALA